ncbi:m7GpppX diphosphatase-like [Tubulanus polymorphus]|uniref:m7GpppX diphosphatase-like n=1 Tax=Tubulanus polymorphus TaxID=672921 RepID=UPI003DA2F169
MEGAKKKAKLDANDRSIDDQCHQPIGDFSGFKILKILNENHQSKTIFVHGKFTADATTIEGGDCANSDDDDDDAVAILEKTAFNKDSLQDLMSKDMSLKNSMHNDIYGTYSGRANPELNEIKVTLIYPASQKHIDKYTEHEPYLICETATDYDTITLPHLHSQTFSIQWVYNILEKKKEWERIVFEDSDPENGFILLPDMKWDQSQADNLYLVAIVHKHGIKSLRDLTNKHLPLLTNIRDKTVAVVEEKYGITRSQLRMYFHYQPSYYHLHIHVTHLKYDAPGSNITKAHLLDDIISNIQLKSDYYQTQALMFTARDNDPLFVKYKQAGKID